MANKSMRDFFHINSSAVSAGLALCVILTGVAAAQEGQSAGLGKSFTGLQIQGDQPISIESNQLDVDDRNAVATFSGNVAVAQGETVLRTGKLKVHYKKPEGGTDEAPKAGALPGGSSQIERLDASGKVYVKSADQVATADNASFDMGSQVVVMTGDVVLTQGENVAQGCRLTIKMDTGVARLESQDCGQSASGRSGRVHLMLTPGQQGAGQSGQ
ncbi:LptA/OstA family protein [Aurantimonas sp. VKM B-3413]|uniref:LptA/OstA family protein n=1 Tax=Aurantimonas sp. VKM B-3413 TaxID=2779401 RepID=UPI001E481BE5|nr:LptA/OstA family protein [Aurantimonas sp. VKM B-3413]MCB8839611.1 OstA family protein [Aurantimonas sp. VKM B-3413]